MPESVAVLPETLRFEAGNFLEEWCTGHEAGAESSACYFLTAPQAHFFLASTSHSQNIKMKNNMIN
jgi:hypothetical protein